VKRSAILLVLLTLLVRPGMVHAQWGVPDEDDRLNPYQYEDVDDAQFLKFASYVLTPFGMGLEWGLMRPLHYAATQSSLAPILSGDKERIQFGQNNNADFVPPGTFGPPRVNYSNDFVHNPTEQTGVSSIIEQPIPPPLLPRTAPPSQGQPELQ